MNITTIVPEKIKKPVIADLCENISANITSELIREMEDLRAKKHLTELRGNRRTDLARPLKDSSRTYIEENCPTIRKVVRSIENNLSGSDYFIRALKIDDPRVSSTSPSQDALANNLHFDSEKTRLADLQGCHIYQFYGNLGQADRYFRFIGTPLWEMFGKLVEANLLMTPEETTPQEVLRIFCETFVPPIEERSVPSGHITAFDGLNYAHDAGKVRLRDAPGNEQDIVITLDTISSGFHEGYYFPDRSFLDDPGTSKWWKLLKEPQ